MDWMSSNEAQNNVSLVFSTEDEFSKPRHKTLLSKELGCGWKAGQEVQPKDISKEVVGGNSSIGR